MKTSVYFKSAGETLTRDQMVPASALVSLFLLSDVDYQNPIATVPTDEQGNYTVTVGDVRAYLLGRNLITSSSSDDEILTAFRALGRLQVRAMIIREQNGVQSAMAIQSIADPNDIDDSTGLPNPVAVDPIVHRVVSTVIQAVADAINSLRDLGVSDALVTTLTDSVIQSVTTEIERVISEAQTSVLEVPEGQTLESVIQQQEDEFELEVGDNYVQSLSGVLSGSQTLDDSLRQDLEANLGTADTKISEEDSTLLSSLDSEEQGLLSGLESALSDGVSSEFDSAVEGASDLTAIFGEGASQEQLDAAQAEKARILKLAIQRFFLSMGLTVTVDENDAGTAAVVAIRLRTPAHIPAASLPGGRGFGNRNIRIFKVGSGDLDPDSDYTSNPDAQLGVLGQDGQPQAPLYYAPLLSDVTAGLLGGQTPESFQSGLNDAFARISDPQGSPSAADYALLDRVRVYHQLNRRISESSLVSTNVIDKLVANKDATIRIKRLASVIASNFTWASEVVNYTPEGFPVFTGRRQALAGGADVIDSSEIIRMLSLSLGESATETARILTERLSFYAQYAPDAVQAAIQQAQFDQGTSFNLLTSLLGIYPTSDEGYRSLVMGDTEGRAPTPAYDVARNRVATGLTSAVPPTLFGQTLTSETTVNVRSALFLLDLVLKGTYLVDSNKGYFRNLIIVDGGGADQTRRVPNFVNYKVIEGSETTTVASVVSQLLNITLISNGELFTQVNNSLRQGLSGLPVLPEYKEQNIADFADDLGTRADTVTVSCTVERFDGVDPAAGDSQNQLALSVFAVQFDPTTGDFTKGDAIAATVTSALEPGDGPVRRTYTIENLPSQSLGEYGLDYVVRFDIPSYNTDLPELFFFVDGFVPDLNLCDADYPLFIGSDQSFQSVPGLGIVSDASRPDGQGGSIAEGLDLSNYEQPGAPIYITSQEETAGKGAIDFHFASTTTGYEIVAPTESGVGFAPLFGEWANGVLSLSADPSAGLNPLYGMHSVLGANVRGVIQSVIDTPALLTSSIAIDPAAFDFERLYLMKDRGGRYWIIELRFLDIFQEVDGGNRAFIDIGIGSISSLGDVSTPDEAFDDVPSGGGAGGMMHYRLHYGDWLILDEPTGYTGPEWLEPEQVSFGGSAALYDQLDVATDGIYFRYAGNHFDDNIINVDSFDTVFGNPPDYSSIPVRFNAGRPGITFVKMSFNKADRKYVMSPAPDMSAPLVSNLKHNDIVAVFDGAAADPSSPQYIARVIRDMPADDPYANFEIGLDVVPFAPGPELSPDDVVCFAEEGRTCPTADPVLFISTDGVTMEVGTVFDGDKDGVPTLFDPNDNDANIPGSASSGGGSGGQMEGLFVSVMSESDGQGGVAQSLLVETFGVYPGDIQAVSLESDIFGSQSGQQVVFTCSPPSLSGDVFTDYQCNALSVDGGVTVELVARQGDRVSYKLNVPSATWDGLGSRVDVAYRIAYRAPLDLDGSPILCGVDPCLARPATVGQVSVAIPTSVVVLDDLNVVIGTDAPVGLSSLSTLDVTRAFTLSGETIPGAKEYELQIFCPGSSPGEAYLPEENMLFFAPGSDGSGRAVRPQFHLDVPWIGGRSCDFTLRAWLESSAGDFLGVSSLSLTVTTSGGYSDGGVVDNEITLMAGGALCLVTGSDGMSMPTTQGCDGANTLFSLTSIQGEVGDETATLALGTSVSEASADGGRRELTYGQLTNSSVVSFNVNLDVAPGTDVVPPTCGVISTDTFSDTCAGGGHVVDVMTNFFAVSTDATEMGLDPGLVAPFSIDGPVNSSGAIPLDVPGFYKLIDDSDGTPVLEVEIEVYAGGEVWAAFTLTAGVNFYDGTGDNNFTVAAPSFMRVIQNSGQPVDLEVRYIRDGEVKFAWYLPPPQVDLVGDHDLDGDGVADVSITYGTGTWTFNFANNLSGVQRFAESGPVDLVAAGDGSFSDTADETLGYAGFGLAFSSGRYFNLNAHFDGMGGGSADWFEIFGGDGGGGCPDCPMPLLDFDVAYASSTTLYQDSAGINLDMVGDPMVTIDVNSQTIDMSLPQGVTGIALETMDDVSGSPVSGNTVSLPRGMSHGLFVNYVSQGGRSYTIEVFDTGVNIVVRVFDIQGPGPQPMSDLDGDTILDDVDNCIVIANTDQLDTDQDGLGDLCDVVVPDMTGSYLASISHEVGSQEFDDVAGTCAVGMDEALFVDIKMQGNQILLFSRDSESSGPDLFGVMQGDASFALWAEGDFQATGNFVQGQGFGFTFTESTGSSDGTVICQASASVAGSLPTAVVEQTAFSTGVTWFDSDSFEESPGVWVAEFEYGTISSGALETQFGWDEVGQAWMDITSGAVGSEHYLTDAGVVTVDDILTVTGFVDVDQVAIVQLTDSGTAVNQEIWHVDLQEFDVEGLPLLIALPPEYEQGILDSQLFSVGARVYQASITAQADAYGFWCDDGYDDWFDANLNCDNIVAVNFVETSPGSGNFDPVPATALNDIINTPAEMDSMPVGGIWAGERDDYHIQGYLVSSDGSTTGTGLEVRFVKQSRDGMGSPSEVGVVPASLSTLGATDVIEFTIPDEVARMTGLDDEERTPFVFVETVFETGSPYVRQGRKAVTGSMFHEMMFNATATSDIRDSFSTSTVP